MVFFSFHCVGIVTTLIVRRHDLKVLIVVSSLGVGLESRVVPDLSLLLLLSYVRDFFVMRCPSICCSNPVLLWACCVWALHIAMRDISSGLCHN